MEESKKPPKIPWQQIIILAICRLAEPLCFTSVFPYLPEMIESFHVPQNDVAKWAGISSAVFSISQAVGGVFWGQASDRWGRKSVVLFGLLLSLVASLMFGFSKTLTWMMMARVFAGLISGDVGIIRTAVAELVPQRELQPTAFSILPLTYTVGSIFGPALGGVLANPAKTHPGVFGNSTFFKTYPYALPNLVMGLFFSVSMAVGYLFLNETFEEKKHERDYGRIMGRSLVRTFKQLIGKSKLKKSGDETTPLLKNHADAPGYSSTRDDNTTPRPSVTYREVFSHQSSISLVGYAFLSLHSVAYTQLLAVFMHFPRQENRASDPNVQLPFKFGGGFGIESQRIGIIFTICGIAIIFLQIFIFPIMAHRFGVLYCFRLSSIIHPICYIITPFTALLPTPASQQIAIILVMLARGCGVVIAFPCNNIVLTNSAASPRLLGVLNGVGTTASALGSAIGPALGGYTFSLGMEIGYGILPWWTLAFFGILGAVPIWYLADVGHEHDHDAVNDPQTVVPPPPVDVEVGVLMEGFGREGRHKSSAAENDTLSKSVSNGSARGF